MGELWGEPCLCGELGRSPVGTGMLKEWGSLSREGAAGSHSYKLTAEARGLPHRDVFGAVRDALGSPGPAILLFLSRGCVTNTCEIRRGNICRGRLQTAPGGCAVPGGEQPRRWCPPLGASSRGCHRPHPAAQIEVLSSSRRCPAQFWCPSPRGGTPDPSPSPPAPGWGKRRSRARGSLLAALLLAHGSN